MLQGVVQGSTSAALPVAEAGSLPAKITMMTETLWWCAGVSADSEGGVADADINIIILYCSLLPSLTLVPSAWQHSIARLVPTHLHGE